jgi:hypothetical protein
MVFENANVERLNAVLPSKGHEARLHYWTIKLECWFVDPVGRNEWAGRMICEDGRFLRVISPISVIPT